MLVLRSFWMKGWVGAAGRDCSSMVIFCCPQAVLCFGIRFIYHASSGVPAVATIPYSPPTAAMPCRVHSVSSRRLARSKDLWLSG